MSCTFVVGAAGISPPVVADPELLPPLPDDDDAPPEDEAEAPEDEPEPPDDDVEPPDDEVPLDPEEEKDAEGESADPPSAAAPPRAPRRSSTICTLRAYGLQRNR
jgi:hypothetical protein